MAVGHINDWLISLISYYTSNSGQLEFFHNMLAMLLPKVQGQVILEGDSNLLLDQMLDEWHKTRAQKQQ